MNTDPIMLHPEVRRAVEQISDNDDVTIEELVNRAVRDYVDKFKRQSLESEIQAFEAMHSALIKTHRGQYVAVYRGRVIDADPDFEALYLRVRSQYENDPVLIRPVTREPTETLEIRSPRLESRAQ
jgi:hypothetical protein